MRYLILVICAIALGAAGYFSNLLFHSYEEKNALLYDAAEIKKVNYGIFNLQLWKEQVLDIFTDRISDFKISPAAYVTLEKQVDVFIKQMFDDYITSGRLVDEIATNLENNSKIPKLFITSIKDNVKEQMKNIDMSKQIPGITKQISKEIRKSEPELRKIMQDELMKLVTEEEETKYIERRTVIYEKYGHDTAEETLSTIQSQLEAREVNDKKYIQWIIAALAFILICLSVLFKFIPFREIVLGFTMVSCVLLFLGVTLPTIDLDARLNSFSISLAGADISFDEQVLYFESKSILGVTKTLWDGGGMDLKIVAAMIFLFSIAFPLLKLLLSGLYLYWNKAKESKLVQGVIFYLGKWSMADVFVIAMFMSYIGFYGLVTSQLGSIGTNQTGYAVETLNYTKLGPGALFFTAYVIISIITSLLINRKQLQEK